MKVDSVLLLRVSSSVDKDVEHPQFFDPPYAQIPSGGTEEIP
jgi:hypothetical protein